MWSVSDDALVAGLAAGDRDAASAFVRRFQRRVFGLARTIVGAFHGHRYGRKHQASELKLEGTKGVAVARMGVNLDYPKSEPDSLEVCFLDGAGNWEDVPLRGSWFDEAFEGPMSNLMRFAAGEDAVLVTRVEDALRTMELVEKCYAGGFS